MHLFRYIILFSNIMILTMTMAIITTVIAAAAAAAASSIWSYFVKSREMLMLHKFPLDRNWDLLKIVLPFSYVMATFSCVTFLPNAKEILEAYFAFY